ncbi:unnamed protein product [Euphydryas editha]|uniref:Protein phosphatase 1 regulatory subunit 35 C-terminal domain-containing protein n=1 Tax=Euphydryas editha TaxID=104508 RepID=A0AAU9U3A3_EUPED|nr:unnamed protein product [Euphydryas editha]
MKKAGADPKVKKTLLRNYEQRVRAQSKTVQNCDAGSSKLDKQLTNTNFDYHKDHDLNQPSLCTSEAIANYITDVRKCGPPLSPEDLNFDQAQINAKITKKLNFHFNDKIYKNLVELNSDIVNTKSKHNKKPAKNIAPMKKDLEPNLEDFCQDEKENDICPDFPIFKNNYKPIRKFEDGSLHNLIASFENL